MKYAITNPIQAIQSISAVPTILRVVAETTGMGFVCIARVEPDSWTACAVHDELGFGLKAGDMLDIATTFCDTVRTSNALVAIDKASDDPRYRDHPIPRMYGFESYISVPVHRLNGDFFGTLCALDPAAHPASSPKIVDSMTLFAELISRQLEDEQRLLASEDALLEERETAELREQFVAVLGHDLRTPLSSIRTGAELLQRQALPPAALDVVARIKRSGRRIASLVDDVLDFTRGRMGGGIPLALGPSSELGAQLLHVVAELRDIYPARPIETDIVLEGSIVCDPKRISQLLSNLLVNALIYGAAGEPVRVSARREDGALHLSVSNGGEPISPEKKAALFQPFWRGESKGGDSGPNAGLGLGLYIAAEIARSHGGVLDVTSNSALTTFSFSMTA